MTKFPLILFLALFFPATSFAGEPYDEANGFAASGFDIVAYFAISEGDAALPGKASITVEHEGGTYAFASDANRDAFLADPVKYLPAYDGHCAFGASRGVKTAGAPVFWRIVDDVLYLNGGSRANDLWLEDVDGNIGLADANWIELEPEPAAADQPLDFDPASAPTN